MARRNRAFLLLALALASGAVAAFVALRYLRQQSTPLVSTREQTTNMVVAARALPVGSIIGEQDVKTLEWSGGALPAGYASAPAQVVGRGLLAPVEPNEPIMTSKLAAEGAGGGLSVIIEPGMRALSIAVDQVVGVSGFVLPNSRVDVLLTLQQGNVDPVTKIIMQDVRTLAAGQTIQQDKEGKPMPVPVITLLLSPEQAETLALASSQGRIQLALRNATDTVAVRTRGARQLGTIMGGSTPRPAGGARRTAPRPAAVVPDRSTTVEVYRGGVRTLQRF
jgi:pilus assembly protein CpaB